jgi:hypothetical protein
LVILLGLFGAALFVGYGLTSRRGPLERAAAVIMIADSAPRTVVAPGDAPPVALPVSPVFNRAMLVSVAVDARMAVYSESDLTEAFGAVLKVDAHRALCVVRALGLGEPVAEVPDVLMEAARPLQSWESGKNSLMAGYGLSSDRAEQVRAEVCREAVVHAFDADEKMSHAREVLGRFVALVPAQIDAVLTMAAAIRLVDSGREACRQIRRIAREYPERASPLAEAVNCESG